MPILNSNSVELFSRSPEQTKRLGMRLGAHLQAGDVICLTGDLGAGKTTFVQGIAQGWGSGEAVTSPTFVLINQYKRPDGMIIHHMDAYRMESSSEADELDLITIVEQGILIVEWPERILHALPKEYLWIKMRWLDDYQRSMEITPSGPRYRILLDEYSRQVVKGLQ